MSNGAGQLTVGTDAGLPRSARAGDLGDLDGDGDLDALFVTRDGSTDLVKTLENDGAGVFASFGVSFSTAPGVEQLALEDMDGDGNLEADGKLRPSRRTPPRKRTPPPKGRKEKESGTPKKVLKFQQWSD